jgi:hypothetical protein
MGNQGDFQSGYFVWRCYTRSPAERSPQARLPQCRASLLLAQFLFHRIRQSNLPHKPRCQFNRPLQNRVIFA